MEPGTPEENVIKMLDSSADSWGDLFLHLMGKVVQHPYFGIAVLAAVVYLAVSARKGKRR